MRQNIYIFSNTILRKKNDTLLVETDTLTKPVHEADIDIEEYETLVSPAGESNGMKKKFIPAQNVEAIYTFGSVRMNTQFMSMAAKYSIPVHVFGYYGNYVGSFMPSKEINSGSTLLDQTKHYLNEEKRLIIAKKFIEGASGNANANLKYYKFRNCPLDDETERISTYIELIKEAKSIGELMALEGNVKTVYYRAWEKFLKQDMEFEKRVKRPPDSAINSLMSYGNVIMYSICLNEIYRTGLNPAIGYLHSTGDNRLPLSFDIAEIFKPVIIDKSIFRVINLEMITESDFKNRNGMCLISEKAKRAYVEEIEKKLKTTFYSREMKRSITYRTLIRLECHKLIKHLKGTEEYKPYVQEA